MAPGVVTAAVGVVWTLVVLVGFATLPFYSSHSSGSSSDGSSWSTTSSQTLIEHEGPAVLAVLTVPALVALAGLAGAAFRVPAVSIGVAGIMIAFCVLGMLSVGLFYLPAAVLLVVAAVRSAR